MTLNVGDYFERTVSDEQPIYPNFIKGYRGRVARYDDGCVRDEDGFGHSVNCVRKIDPPNAGPVRTVTRKEIVPGTYGDIVVFKGETCPFIRLEGSFINLTPDRVDRIRAAASTLTEIADALESETPA
jgi:hypothetical protein